MSAIGASLARIEGIEKVTGAADYAYETTAEQETLYGWVVQSSIVTGRILDIGVDAVLALPGVVEVVTWRNAPHLEDTGDGELNVLQHAIISYRGQPVAVVIAETLETAREAANVLEVSYSAGESDVLMSPDHLRLYAPDKVNPAFETDSVIGEVDVALADAVTSIDHSYSTPALFNNPMEPHATTAEWQGGRLELVDSTQGSSVTAEQIGALFGIPGEAVHVRAEHVGGGFGSKGSPRPNVPLAAIAAKITGRRVKLAYTRQMMSSLAGYRTPTVSRMRLGADADGRLTAISHEAFSQTSTLFEFAEQTAEATRHMYAAPNRRTTHRLVALDVPTPRWMRAPGECPGMYALESAMDELAAAAGIDPIELRRRNEPERDPELDVPYSSRDLIGCMERGAELFGWAERDPRPAAHIDGRWAIGTGMAASTYPAMAQPSGAVVTAMPDGRYRLGINATDIGTGSRTVMRQIAADALDVEPEAIDIRIADSNLPKASVAGGSSGTASWGWAVTKACRELRISLQTGMTIPPDGITVTATTDAEIAAQEELSRHAFGAQFVEVRVDLDSGEVVVPRMVGVFAAGRIMNPRLARSQFIGAMTMGLGMALHEVGELDTVLGDYANHDFATYHIPACADVKDIRVEWLDEEDTHLSPMGGKGIGEIGIVGAAAAVANAVAHATGIRVRDLPIQPDKLIADLPARF
ncbi:xanthine dehydrogenase family protein molybdopterin-binding subunit [Naasia lichenicola]|uniref:Xanthine dehydrogenase family protein molybdopterin-binding subunit n=1 Tax=Naasia lichenicola TaxID=2565933 RepID=A0A4S4FPK9_9MICO|nr:xanthine dehydrogenase family protein molybdopterin-binding subunit [Naasia lichenicola]THG31742.1 xanthine dehydrogenase family protein molybdopterin-binding subunit [Naasia lichenicola]